MDDGLPAQPQAGFPGNYVVMPALNRAFDHWWANDPVQGRGLQEWYADAWRHVARRFRDQPNLLGYDLLNEPWPGSVWSTCANPVGCPVFDTQQLTPFSRRVYERIRQVDRRGIVWYEPNVIYNNGPETHHGDVGEGAGMSFHIYCLAEGSTPGPQPLDPVQAAGCEELEDRPFRNADAQSQRTGDSLLLTEFGATDDLDQIERITEKADRHMVGWQYWHYCTCTDPTTTGGGDAQALVYDPAKPPAGDNVDVAKLLRLARPYPQAVAGTPVRWGFDRDTRVFELEYTTARPDGSGAFAPEALTEVFVGRRHYPDGYRVAVQGGEAVSGPDEPVLRLRASAATVKVAITPR